MQIHGATYVHGPHALQGPHRAAGQTATAPSSRQPVDQLDLSREAQELSQARAASDLRQDSGIRHDLVSRVRQEIAAGTYETEEKLDRALTRLLDELG